MLDLRLRPARDRGLDALLVRVLPSGSLGPDADDAAACHLVPGALAASGHLAAAHRVLDHVVGRYLSPDGEVRTSPELRSALPAWAESAAALNAGLIVGAVRSGRPGLAARLGVWLEGLRAAPLTAAGGALTHGPATGAGNDGVTDLGSTVRVATADLFLGRLAAAAAGARYVAALWAAQPHPDALLLRRDGGGALVTLWPASASPGHALHALGPGQGHGVLGLLLTFLLRLSEARAPDAPDLVALARDVLRFAERCEPHVGRASDAAELAAGAALAARLSGERTALDLAVVLARRALAAQDADGTWGPPGCTAMERVEQTARVCMALQDLLAGADEVDPRPVPAPPTGYRVVLCNAPVARAQAIADAVVAERLAACVNAIHAVQSTYEWKGKVEREAEVTLMLKTTAERVAALTARLRELHPYELPEVIVLPVLPSEGNPAYLDWIGGQVSPRE